MFRTVPMSIISSYSLYTQQWYMSYRFLDSLKAISNPVCIALCTVKKLLMMDIGTVRNM